MSFAAPIATRENPNKKEKKNPKPISKVVRRSPEESFEFPASPAKSKPLSDEAGNVAVRRKSSGGSSTSSTMPPAKPQAPRTASNARPSAESPNGVTDSSTDASQTVAATPKRFVLDEERAVLHEKYPFMAEASQTAIDAMRKPGGEFERFDMNDQVYLDYTGGGQYAKSQVEMHMKQLTQGVFGNPHSVNPTSAAATKLVDEARASILDHFNASSDEYVCIITANASGALHIVGESYPFNENSHFLLLVDNHNSVNGIREFATSRGAKVTYSHVSPDNLRMNVDELAQSMENLNSRPPSRPGTPEGKKVEGHKLLAFPAQSNFSGVKHPLDIIPQAQALGWDVLLDAAAFAPTNVLDLGIHKPDFVSLSFYKMFGYPTGLGALIAKKSALKKLVRPWFAGGTVEVAAVAANRHWYAPDHEMFEDGTVSYLTIPAIRIGLDFMHKVGMNTIHDRVRALTGYLLAQMQTLFHSSGVALVRIFGPRSMYNRGGTLTFDVYDKDNKFISDLIVEQRAMQCNISIRAGCFCNPGDAESIFESWAQKGKALIEKNEGIDVTKSMMRRLGSDFGAVRVSVGLPTNLEDVVTFLNFIASFRDLSRKELAAAPAH